MRYPVRTESDPAITLPDLLYDALGRPETVDVEQTPGGLVVRAAGFPGPRSAVERLAAVDTLLARWAEEPIGGCFAPGELDSLLEGASEHEQRKSEEFLDRFHGDLPA